MTSISINHMTKIEGHASLTLKIENGKVEKCDLNAVEGSRYFEGLLVGKGYEEACWVSTRICGICSCAHNVTAVQAIENALDIKVTEQTYLLRKLYTIGERIRSHGTHLYFLVLPDFLGYESAFAMAPQYKDKIVAALQLVKLGNNIITMTAGRDMHPIATVPGGFTRVPKQAQLDEIYQRFKEQLPVAIETFKLFAGLTYPDVHIPTQYFSLHKEGEYAMIDGAIKTPNRIFEQKDFHQFCSEFHDSDNSANFVVNEGRKYQVGALARLNNNYDQLRPSCKKLLSDAGFTFPSTNPHHQSIGQAIELVHNIEEGMWILENLKVRDEEPVKFALKEGHGIAAVEVPRGTLWHEYKVNAEGKITYANIVTPTAQNLRNMQEDLRTFVPTILDYDKDAMVMEIEKLIRAYDPCFSCATHFLKVKWE